MLTSVVLIPFYMYSHVGICVSFVFVAVCAEVACIPHSIMLTYMPVKITQVFEGSPRTFTHTG